jgi:hypothetical protein
MGVAEPGVDKGLQPGCLEVLQGFLAQLRVDFIIALRIVLGANLTVGVQVAVLQNGAESQVISLWAEIAQSDARIRVFGGEHRLSSQDKR